MPSLSPIQLQPDRSPSVDETVISDHNKVEALTKNLKRQFQDEYHRKGSLVERRTWIRANENLQCTACIDTNAQCVPSREYPRCETCKRRKSSGCSRVAQERKERLVRTLGINEATYDALNRWYEGSEEEEVGVVHPSKNRQPARSVLVQQAVPKVAVSATTTRRDGGKTGSGTSSTSPNKTVAAPTTSQKKVRKVMIVDIPRVNTPVVANKPRPQPRPLQPKPKAPAKPSPSKPLSKAPVQRKPTSSTGPSRAIRLPETPSESPKKKGPPVKAGPSKNAKTSHANVVSTESRTRTSTRRPGLIRNPISFRDLDRSSSSEGDDSENEEEEEQQVEEDQLAEDEAGVQEYYSDEGEDEESDDELRVKQEMIEDAFRVPVTPKVKEGAQFIQLHVYKREIEHGMKQVPRGSNLWNILNGVSAGLEHLASEHLDVMTSSWTSKQDHSATHERRVTRVQDDEFEDIAEQPVRKKARRT